MPLVDPRDTEARQLHQKIVTSAQLVAQNLWEMCSALKEMRDKKLYIHLGHQNFEEYCENELQITRQQAYKYISIVNNLKPDFVNSSLQIGVTKLALLASISDDEREQVMTQTDVESATVRELRDQIKGLQAEKERLKTDLSESSEVVKTLQSSNLILKQQNSELAKKNKNEKQQLTDENTRLAAELEDLKNNPLPEDKYRIAAKKHDRDMMEYREQADKALHEEQERRWNLQEQFDDFRKKQQDIVKELERQLREAQDKPPAVIEVTRSDTQPEAEKQIFQAYINLSDAALSQALLYIEGAENPLPLYEEIRTLLKKYNDMTLDWRFKKYGTTV